MVPWQAPYEAISPVVMPFFVAFGLPQGSDWRRAHCMAVVIALVTAMGAVKVLSWEWRDCAESGWKMLEVEHSPAEKHMVNKS